MANIISKYGYLVKKIDATWVIISVVNGVICQSPISNIDNNIVKVKAYDKTDVNIKKFASDNGFTFITDYEDLV